MRKIYARKITEEERKRLKAGLKSNNVVEVRRSQIILMSADEKMTAVAIGERVGQSDQQVRNVLHDFNANSSIQSSGQESGGTSFVNAPLACQKSMA